MHLLQIWILPDRKGVKPRYAEKSFASARTGHLHFIASGTGRDGSININQDADVFVAKLERGQNIEHNLKNGRHAWIQVAEGNVELNGQSLAAGDGAAISEESKIQLSANGPAQALVFDLN